jgi:hypothetical protein
MEGRVNIHRGGNASAGGRGFRSHVGEVPRRTLFTALRAVSASEAFSLCCWDTVFLVCVASHFFVAMLDYYFFSHRALACMVRRLHDHTISDTLLTSNGLGSRLIYILRETLAVFVPTWPARPDQLHSSNRQRFIIQTISRDVFLAPTVLQRCA